MRHLFKITILLIACASTALAQNNVGLNTATPDSSAILHLESTTQGLLIPRMTGAQRDSIANPADGLVVYSTTDSAIYFFNGICWQTSYQESCDDCFFNLTANSMQDTIDRVIADSVQITLTLNQSLGSAQNIALQIIGQLPTGLTYSFSNNPQFSSGTLTLTIHVTPFTPAGTYPIVIQGLCGPSVENLVYSLTILPCYNLTVQNSITNYSVSADLYATYPTAPTLQPVCVTSTVNPGVSITSNDTVTAAVTTGTLPANSLVAIINNGNIIGKGGDAGEEYDPIAGKTGNGFKGGDAITLTENTDVINNGNIFGGGGGGGSMAFGVSYTTPSIPIVGGTFTFGVMIGAGGGGGAGGGLGMQQPTGFIGPIVFVPGTDGTAGLTGLGGDGGLLNYPVTITVSIIDVILNPSVVGGDGGDYGYPGTQGSFYLTIDIIAQIPLGFLGTFPLPVVSGLVIPIPAPPPIEGKAGFAIRRNGNTCNIQDNYYLNSNLKGEVGN